MVDHNPALAQRAKESWPDVVVVENTSKRGISASRNVGIAAAKAEIIAFLDDDALAAPTWLASMLRVYDDELPLAVGGDVQPLWQGGRPSWFPREFDWVVGCGYRGLPVRKAPVRNVIGTNMSFRKEVLELLGGFDTELGRVDSIPVGCDETELCIRARERWPSGRILYDPRIRVTHRVSHKRGTVRYFVSRCYGEGRSKAVVRERAARSGVLSTELAYAIRTLPAGVVTALRDAQSGDASGVMRAGAIVLGLGATTFGYGVERLARSTASRRRA